jgi:uncharacterized phage protein gp47/JayE
LATPTVNSQFYPTKEELKALYLRRVKHAARIANSDFVVNVLPGSEYDLRGDAIASVAAPAYANNKLANIDRSPLQATGTEVGDPLYELTRQYGVSPRAASPATGYVLVNVAAAASVVGGPTPPATTVTIPAGYVCQAPDGLKYTVVSTTVAVQGTAVQVKASTGGEDTNQDPATPMVWVSTGVGKLLTNCQVDSDGLTGGTSADGEQELRNRLLDRLSFPSVGGNWAQSKQWAEDASSTVSDAFVYCAARGPGSIDIALVKEDGDRTVSSVVINAVASAVAAQLPGHVDLNVTTVASQLLDVVIDAQLPLPVFAGGAGGGWKDATPWPNATSGSVKITAINGTNTQITTNASALNGVAVGHHIAIWNPDDETLYQYEVSEAVVDGGFVKIKVIGGFSWDPSGAYISADAENLDSYCASLLESFQALGPGEKTSDGRLLPRAYRRPTQDVKGPTDVGSKLLATVTNDYPEILSLEFRHRYETGTTTTRSTPGLPSATSDPPKILAVEHMAFMKST